MGFRRLDEYLRQISRGVQEGSIDVEALIRRLVEEIVKSLGPVAGCGGQQTVAPGDLEAVIERLSRIEERLERIEERLGELESRGRVEVQLSDRDVERLASVVAGVIAKAVQQVRMQRQEPRWLQTVMEKVRERGYVLLSELSEKVREEVNTAILAEKGLLVERVAGDVVIASVEGIKRFIDMLSKIRTSDEYEAEIKLADYARLFRLLRQEGLVYYRHGRGWVVKAFKSIHSS